MRHSWKFGRKTNYKRYTQNKHEKQLKRHSDTLLRTINLLIWLIKQNITRSYINVSISTIVHQLDFVNLSNSSQDQLFSYSSHKLTLTINIYISFIPIRLWYCSLSSCPWAEFICLQSLLINAVLVLVFSRWLLLDWFVEFKVVFLFAKIRWD